MTLLECLAKMENNINFYFYKVEHDFGLAPNPFHGYCTLAVCKSKIRNNTNLKIGDWVIGVGSKSLKNHNQLVFAMCLEEKITFNEYWNDERFLNKRPVVNGSLVQMYGDNFYHQESGKWIQEDSAHSLDDKENSDHRIRDISGEYVLISQKFYYFGDLSINVPEISKEIFDGLRSMRYKNISDEIKNAFISLLKKYPIGIHGDPISWKDHLSDQEKGLWKKQLHWEKGLKKQ